MSSGQVLVDLHRRVGRDRGGLHEGRDAAHLADRGVRPGELEPEVGRVLPPGAREQPRAEVAEVLLARSAPAAVPAGGQEREDDVVALLDPLVVRRCRRDDARALVAARERVDTDRDVAGGDVVVGVAKAGGHQLDLDLARTWVVDLEVHDLVLAGCLANDRPARLHVGSPLNGLPPFIAARACIGKIYVPLTQRHDRVVSEYPAEPRSAR